jgi:hypothetical protein
VNTILALVAKRLIPPDLQPRFIDFYAKYKYALIKFHCPFCEKGYSHLLPAGYYLPSLKDKKVVGAGYRLHAVCPGCGSSDRERLVYLYLTTKTEIFLKPITLLHVAPEDNLREFHGPDTAGKRAPVARKAMSESTQGITGTV